MEKFLLLIREDLAMLKQIGDESRFKRVGQMTKWVESLAESGNYLGGEPLMIAGKYVNKDTIVSDGPFIEAKEGISGYIFFLAENLEQAASIAQTCPPVMEDRMVIEIRPVMTMNKSVINE